MADPRVLIVITSHNTLGDTEKPTGFWLEEFTAPYYAFVDGGAVVTLASIQGGQPPLDPKSDAEEAQTNSTRRFSTDAIAQEALANTIAVDQLQVDDYDAVFLPGGHGTMWDFPTNEALIQLLEDFNKSGKVIAAVCHAPAALVNLKERSGAPLVKGKSVTSFTNSEESAVQLEEVVPFLLETRLKELGGTFQNGPDWGAFVQQDGDLITGQNPASSEPAAQAVLDRLASRVGVASR